MCITFFQLSPQSPIRFIMAFNRDESSSRKTEPLGSFSDDPNIYAGKDVVGGGTWLGVNVKTGIIVMLTNFRNRQRNGQSRGLLVKHFLDTNYFDKVKDPNNSEMVNNAIHLDLCEILGKSMQFSGFNLCVYNIKGNTIFYICSETQMKVPRILQTNVVNGVSNTDIDTKWEKVQRGKKMFREIIKKIESTKTEKITNEDIFLEMEKVMHNKDGNCFSKICESSIFIPQYWSPFFFQRRMTRSTFYTVVRAKQDGKYQIQMKQVTYSITGEQKDEIVNIVYNL